MHWFKQRFSRRRRYHELSEAIREHLDEKIADLIDHGMTREQAESTARREFGNMTLIEERSREVWQWPTVESVLADTKFALRQLRRSPGFSAVAILSLALGIGAATSMFSLIYAVLIHPVPYADWEHLVNPVMLNDDKPGSPERWFSVTWQQYQDLLKVRSIEDVLGIQYKIANITDADIPEDVTLTYYTENVGSFRRVPALIGRNLQRSDAKAASGQQAPVVLSYSFWMRHYHGDHHVLGHILTLDHEPYIIVGVMPENYESGEPNLYVPMSLLTTRERDVTPVMKLKPGIRLAAADAEIGALVHEFAKEDPQYFPKHFRIRLQRIASLIMQNGGHALSLLTAAVLMLLLIGCTNCSILLLARGMTRQGEIAVRSALGAGPSRLIRQLLVESLTLAVIGSFLGVGLAYWMAKLILSLFSNTFMHESVIRINPAILLFSVTLATASGLLFGLLPSLQTSRPDISQIMQAIGRKFTGGPRHARSLNTLIAAQIALTIILMGAAGTAVGSFMKMTSRNLGYDPAHVMSVPIPLHANTLTTREGRAAYFEALREKIATIPGITQVAVSSNATPPDNGDTLRFEILGAPSAQWEYLLANFIGSHYFSALHIPLLAGRLWDESENTHGAAVAVINQAFARHYFPKGNATGQLIRMPALTLGIGDPGQVVGVPDINGWLEVIGVVADSVDDGLDKLPLPAVYIPYTRYMWMRTSFLVRTQGPPLALLHAVQRAIQSVNADQFEPTERDVLDLDQWIELRPEFQQQRLFSILFNLFSSLALVLALVGLYSVVSYSVAQRTGEFGVRMALGAQRTHIIWIVGRGISVTILSGLATGLVVYAAIHRVFVHWIQSNYSNPLILVGEAALFLTCAGFACTFPALRAAAVDPVEALRSE